MMMYKSLLEMVGHHEWSAEEQETVLKFRARFGELWWQERRGVGHRRCSMLHCVGLEGRAWLGLHSADTSQEVENGGAGQPSIKCLLLVMQPCMHSLS